MSRIEYVSVIAEDTFSQRAVPAKAQFIRQNHAMRSLSSLAIPLLVTQGRRVNERKSGRLDSIPIGCSYAVCTSHFFFFSHSPPPVLHPGSATAPPSSRVEMLLWSAVRNLCVWWIAEALPRGLRDFYLFFFPPPPAPITSIRLCHKPLASL